MKSLLKMTYVEAKLFLREPVGAFFTLIFPLLMLFIFGTIYNSQPASIAGSQGSIDDLIPSFSGMIIGITGLMAITMTMATYRENGILRRLRTTPVNPLVVMLAQLVVVFTMTLFGMLLLIIVGKLVYHVQFTGNPFSILGGFILGCLSFFGIGFILAGNLPTARTAQIVAMVLVYPMLIFSGAAWPRELMPVAMQKIAAFVPLTYVVNLLRGLWIGESWGSHLLDVYVLIGMFLLGILISVRTFRWE
jgi:ABC-2 type transport system permease protein